MSEETGFAGGVTPNVKSGDRVVYSTGEKEYDAVALSVPMLGHHPGLKAANYHLNVAYLDDAGNRVLVMGAPLQTVAASEEQKKAIAVAAAWRDPGFGKLTLAEQEKVVAHHVEKQNEQPRTFGWREYRPNDAIRMYKRLRERFEDLKAILGANAVPADKDELEPLPL